MASNFSHLKSVVVQDGGLQVTAVSAMSGETNTRLIAGVTWGQLLGWLSGVLIQDAMPMVTADDREFLMTGVTPSEWECLVDRLPQEDNE